MAARPPAGAGAQPTAQQLLLYVNGERVLGCGEGGCGACTVVVSRYSVALGRPVHRAVDACLTPLCAADAAAITTVEGLAAPAGPGGPRLLHPLQGRLAAAHGSQCGFCTPGVLMALYAFFLEHPRASLAHAEASLDGTPPPPPPPGLCLPILETAASVRPPALPPSQPAAHTLCCQFACDGKGGCGCGGQGPDVEDLQGCGREPMRPARPFPEELERLARACAAAEATGAPSPRPSLAVRAPGSAWHTPATLEELLVLRNEYPGARLVVGASELALDLRFRGAAPAVWLCPARVPELSAVRLTDTALCVGAALPLADVADALEGAVAALPRERTAWLRALRAQLGRFACRQVRNTACLGGNLATASPTSDLGPLLLAANALLDVRTVNFARTLPLAQFYTGYRRVALDPDELIVSINVPLSEAGQHVQAYKISRRRDDDIHICNACFSVTLVKTDRDTSPQSPPSPSSQQQQQQQHQHQPGAEESGPWVSALGAADPAEDTFAATFARVPTRAVPAYRVKSFRAAFGSMDARTRLSASAASFLEGQLWTSDVLAGVYNAIALDLPIVASTPGGMPSYRRVLARSLFFKFFLRVCADVYGADCMPPGWASCLADLDKGPLSSSQDFEEQPLTDTACVGASHEHLAAQLQVSGEALFLDDLPGPPSQLHAAPIASTRAHARVLRIDDSAARAVPGVVDVVTARDIPGGRRMYEDEELFASEEVVCVGFWLGLVLATSQRAARLGAAKVVVEYEALPAILTIREAVAAGSYHCSPFSIARGDVEAALRSAPHTVEGEVTTGGQDHFYLEPQCAVATPGEGGEMQLVCSTQDPSHTQHVVAHLLGVAASRVVVRVKRVGGGFGGKESRNIPFAAAAAVAAARTRRSVRFVADRDVDMAIHGSRHPFVAQYRVGFGSDGRLVAGDFKLYCNGGYSTDLTIPVLQRALFHVDNAYYYPALRVVGYACKTHRPSNTAFRGFGGPQGVMAAETVMARISAALGIEAARLREANFYREGQLTHYGEAVLCNNLQRCWADALESSDYHGRRAEVTAFNVNNRFRKRGIYATPVKFGLSFTHPALNQAGALVLVYTDGSVLVTHGGCEIGQGIHTKMCQVAAHALGIPLSLVHISETSTDKIKRRLEEFKGTRPAEAARWSWEQLVAAAYNARIDLGARGFYSSECAYDWATHSGKPFAYFSYGAAVTEVEVDTLTGEHVVRRADVVMDLGQSLNPALDVGQIEGAFLQGLGWCTIEELVTLSDGRLYTCGPGTYKVPSAGDVPADFRVRLLRGSANPFAVHSSKGVGEPPLILGLSAFFALKEAIASARADAGIHGFFQLGHPATCERIRLACRDALTEAPGAPASSWCIEEFPVTPDVLATLAAVEAGFYTFPATGACVDLSRAVADAVDRTELWQPGRPLPLGPAPAPAAAAAATAAAAAGAGATRVGVTGELSLEAARRLARGHARVAVLNFASARSPGGGFTTGARAQEEALCRCSALYECLRGPRVAPMYTENRRGRSLVYADYAAYSPGVPVFRSDNGDWLEAPYRVSFLTVPAPNARAAIRAEGSSPALLQRIATALQRRAGIALSMAAEHGDQAVVLGAWGCGVFGNSAEQVADAFARLLLGPCAPFASAFAEVVFAVPDDRMAAVFRARLASN
eukprot:m51a1_g239 xanthine dehydrogenase/oxidase, putative (1653) ;mRNA; r:133370-139333